MNDRIAVTGEIRVENPPDPLPPATLYVRLLDVTETDASARVISETRLDGFDWVRASRAGVPFALSVDAVDPRSRYVLSALVDVDGDGRTGANDYISKQSYPVLTCGSSARATLFVERARP